MEREFVRAKRLVAAMAATLLFQLSAFGGEIVCAGTVTVLSYHANPASEGGALYMRLSSMNTIVAVCSPDVVWTVPGTSYVTPPDTCKALYATLLSARLSGLPVNNMYFDGDSVPAACNAWSNWSRANIRHYAF